MLKYSVFHHQFICSSVCLFIKYSKNFKFFYHYKYANIWGKIIKAVSRALSLDSLVYNACRLCYIWNNLLENTAACSQCVIGIQTKILLQYLFYLFVMTCRKKEISFVFFFFLVSPQLDENFWEIYIQFSYSGQQEFHYSTNFLNKALNVSLWEMELS